MDNYETDVARQSGGPFSNRRERQTIRWATERWVEKQRYSEALKRRLSSYGWWFGVGTPAAIGVIKLIEAYFGK